MSAEGWWAFNDVDLFEPADCEFCAQVPSLEVKITSATSQSEFRMKEAQNRTLAQFLPGDQVTYNYEINDKDSFIKIKGDRDLVVSAILN